MKKILGAVGHFIAQTCQFKNIRKKDRAGIGHLFMMWAFCSLSRTISFLLSSRPVSVSRKWKQFSLRGLLLDHGFCRSVRTDRSFMGDHPPVFLPSYSLEGQRTWESLVILITVLYIPSAYRQDCTQIAAGVAPAGQGMPNPRSVTRSRIFSDTNIAAWHTFCSGSLGFLLVWRS